LGNLDSEKDWGYAPEYVEAMWLMLQQDEPNDLVLATGELCSVRDFAREAFAAVRLSIRFEGSGLSERGIDELTGREVIRVSEKFFEK